jgi:hypothetical protein
MAAEIATGVLVLREISQSGQPVSMLVIRQSSVFTKKAKGLIRFTCDEGEIIRQAVIEAIHFGEGQVLELHAEGKDESGDVVSTFVFEWSLKLKE